ncbi:hypothetical protein C8J57DRAFT_1561416 [Mycena rebaudengoi]|nr:hypothetical protein C8J57DRAFT_1561416 [Mycena rebaudengoi]
MTWSEPVAVAQVTAQVAAVARTVRVDYDVLLEDEEATLGRATTIVNPYSDMSGYVNERSVSNDSSPHRTTPPTRPTPTPHPRTTPPCPITIITGDYNDEEGCGAEARGCKEGAVDATEVVCKHVLGMDVPYMWLLDGAGGGGLEAAGAKDYCFTSDKHHWDLHTKNLALNGEGVLKLTDFSNAVQVKPKSPRCVDPIGIPYWQAPDVRFGSYNVPNVEVWSVGAMVWELTEARPPFSDTGPPVSEPALYPPAFHEFFVAVLQACGGVRGAGALLETPFIQRARGQPVIVQLLSRCMAIAQVLQDGLSATKEHTLYSSCFALDLMDPVTAVGLVASILQLVAAKAVIDLGRDARNATKDQRDFLLEIENLAPLLEDLKHRKLEKPLGQLKETMEHITRKLGSMNKVGSKALFWTFWSKKKVEEDLAKIERFKAVLNAWLLLDNWDVGQQIRTEFGTISQNQREYHDGILIEVRSVVQNQHGLQDCKPILTVKLEWDVNKRPAVEREKIVKEHEKIFSWLSPPNFFARHADIFETRQKGTGLWFLREKQFQDWLSSGGTPWCHRIRAVRVEDYGPIMVHDYGHNYC